MSVKEEAQQASIELQALLEDTPKRARAFHRIGESVIRDFQEEMQGFFPKKTVLLDLIRQKKILQDVKERLKALILAAIKLEQRLEELKDQSLLANDRGLAAAFAERHAEWRKNLESTGVRVENLEDLDLEIADNRLGAVETAVLNYDLALKALAGGDDLLERLGKGPYSADLENRWKELRVRLISVGADARWISEADQIQTAMRSMFEQRSAPLRKAEADLSQFRRALPKLDGWIQILREFCDPSSKSDQALLDKLIRQQKQLEEYRRGTGQSTAQPPDVRQLLDQLGALDEQIKREIECRRKTLRDEFSLDLEHFQTAGQQLSGSVLHMRAGLDQISLVEEDSYRKWKGQYSDVRTEFVGLAQTRVEALKGFLERRLGELQEEVAKLLPMRMPGALRSDVGGAQGQIDQLRQAGGRENVLRALRKLKEVENRLRSVQEQAIQEHEAFNRRWDGAMARAAEVRQAAESSKIPLDLEFEQIPESANLDVAREILERNEQKIASAGTRFGEQVSAEIAQARDFCKGANDILSSTGSAADSIPGGLPEGAGPAALAAALALGRSLLAAARLKLVEKKEQVAGQLSKMRERLNQHAIGAAEEHERAEANSLLGEMDLAAGGADKDEIASLEKMIRLIRKCDAFFSRLEPERVVQDRIVQLKSRLGRLMEQDLGRYAPTQLLDRAMGLITACPVAPRDGVSAKEQLQDAEHIMTRLESHCNRLAALEVSEHCRLVADLVKPGSAAQRQALERLLEKVQASGHASLPPFELRAELRKYASRSMHA